MVKIAILLALLVAAAGAGFGYGHMRGVISGTQSNAQALDDARSQLNVATTALDELRTKLTELRTRHAKALADALVVLDRRDVEIQALERAAKARSTGIRGVVDEDPSCVALARLPVCAAVADRLWPAPGASRSMPPH